MDGKQELGLSRQYQFLDAKTVLDEVASVIRHKCWLPDVQDETLDEAVLTRIGHLLEETGRSVVDWA